MQRTSKWIGAGLCFVFAAAPGIAATTEVFRNEKVIVTEETLAPGEQETVAGEHASVVTFLSGDAVQGKYVDGRQRQDAVQRGEVLNEAAGRRIVTNVGHAPLKLVRVEFLTTGSDETWGMTGLAPNYKALFEDQHSRTYDIRIAAHAWEPQHTHHARVVICLSGAQLEHVLPDGSVQPSTLKTDEVAWRLGQTHKGHNLGNTDLWVIAIEPK
ncbi:MAG: hypothetical protein P4K93_01265 [Terracidiphilus sp.]|nr:hypothetical protein [Terracidiphilus sp.]MDR3796748.1 hypothetical protein [Terracidiphilus sp.]